MHELDDRYEWVSTREAAERLGVSTSTVERLIRKGRLVAEREERPGGSRLRVRFERPQDTPQEPQQAASPDAGPIESDAASEPRQATPEALTAALETIGALTARVADLGAQNAALSERVGRAEAERDLLRAEVERLRARRWWQRWWQLW